MKKMMKIIENDWNQKKMREIVATMITINGKNDCNQLEMIEINSRTMN